MGQEKKTLMFYVRSTGEYTDFLTTAKLLVDDYRIVMVNEMSVEAQGHGYLRQKAEDMGCKCYDLSMDIKASNRARLLWILMKNCRITVPLTLHGVFSNLLLRGSLEGVLILKAIFYIVLIKEFLREILINENPCALIVNNVNGGTLGELAIACAREQGVKSILMPYTFISPIAPLRVFLEKPGHWIKGVKLRIAQKYFPEWIYFYEGKYLLRKTSFVVFVLKLLKASPPMPWIQDSSTADIMMVESAFMKAHYESLGIVHANMQVTGKPNQDYLYSLSVKKDTLARELHDELQFVEEKPFLLLAIPPRFVDFKEKEGRASEFSDYEEIVDFLLETVSHIKHFNVLVCLHPRERARIAEKVFRKDSLPGHVKYSTRDTAELMSVSELYIMAGSSTALWALALKLPVIDYDVYGFRFDFFGGNPDVTLVTKKQEFRNLLAKVDGDPHFLEQKKALLNERGDYYGLLDGQSVKRIKQLINLASGQ